MINKQRSEAKGHVSSIRSVSLHLSLCFFVLLLQVANAKQTPVRKLY